MSDIQDEIRNTLSDIAEAFDNKKQADFGEIAERILNSENGAYWWKSAENFWLGFIFPLKQALEVALVKKYPNVTREALSHIAAIYANYSAIEKHIHFLIKHFEGGGGITDKSRRLIKSHLRWLTEGGEIDDLTDYEDHTKRGWNCPQKGTPEQWNDYMIGITSFYAYSNTVEIMSPYCELINLYIAPLLKDNQEGK